MLKIVIVITLKNNNKFSLLQRSCSTICYSCVI